jgi:hypothetical protein
MKNKGWVKFHREQFNHWISKKPFCDGYAWTYLYSRANFKKSMINFRNEYIEVMRGQFLTSKLQLQEIFGWTYRHVENFLLALKNDENIIYRTTNRYIIITIINYEIYQSDDEQNDKQNDKQVKNRLGTDYKRGNTNKNVLKNDNNENNVKDIYMDAVFLTKDEYQKLIEKFGEDITKDKIEELNNYIKSRGKENKYKSHYHTILSWYRKDIKEGKSRLPNEIKTIKQLAQEDKFNWEDNDNETK